MEDPDSIEAVSDTTRLLPNRSRRNRLSSTRMSETEPTSLIVRNRTISTTSQLPEIDDEDDFEGNCCTDPSSRCHRLIALILMCLLGFGSYFCFDNPGALQVSHNATFFLPRATLKCPKRSFVVVVILLLGVKT